MPAAIVFDFDGLLLDTETPQFEAWRCTFEHFGAVPIDATTWTTCIGLPDGHPASLDPVGLLRAQIGDVDADEVQRHRRSVRDTLLDEMPLQPGAQALLEAAAHRGIPLAIASSSPVAWVDAHLRRRSARGYFATLSCVDDGVPGKPDPATYANACAALGVAPDVTLAFEDSGHGVTAAKAAGLHCIAVPTWLTGTAVVAHADHVLDTLADVAIAELRRGSTLSCPPCGA